MSKIASMAALCCAVILSILAAQPSSAVPAFARRTGRQCQTCHFRPPELNVEGQNFLLRGLRLEPPDEPQEDAEAPDINMPLGVPYYLKWANYLSVIGHHDFVAESGQVPYFDAGAIDVWIGGPITPHWTGLVNPSFDIENGGSDVDTGYGQYVTKWSNRFGAGRFGQMLPHSILLNQGGPSLFLSTPVVLSTPADTGNTWTPSNFLRGLEFGQVGIPHWNAYFGLADPRLDDSQTSQLGFQNSIDWYTDAQWYLGFLDSSITAYSYWGHAWLSLAAPSEPFRRTGAFFNIYGPETKGTICYMAGIDEAANGRVLGSSGGFVMFEHNVTPPWTVYGRYDWLDEELAESGYVTISGPTIGASYWAASQVWVTAELQFLKQSGQGRQSMATIELDWAF